MPTINNLPSLTTATGQMLFPIVDVTVNPNVTKKATLDTFASYVAYKAPIGYTGSQGVGYTGSASTVIGYTGSAGSGGQGVGYTGSQGIQGMQGIQGIQGYYGSYGYTGSASTVIGYTGSAGFLGSVGSGLASRTSVQTTTVSLTTGSSSTATITMSKGYALYSIQSSVGAWVTLYTSATAQSSDSTRIITTDPTPGSGVIAEAITTTAGTTYFTPAVYGFNADPSISTKSYIKIYNNSSATDVITVTLTYLQLEV